MSKSFPQTHVRPGSVSVALQSPVGVVTRVTSSETGQRHGTAQAMMETWVPLPLLVVRWETRKSKSPCLWTSMSPAHTSAQLQLWAHGEGAGEALLPRHRVQGVLLSYKTTVSSKTPEQQC